MMVDLLTVKGFVWHTDDWNKNRQEYNLKQIGNQESPRGYNIYSAGETFVLKADATGLPDTIDVVMSGGFTTQLSPTDADRTTWTGELSDPAFENLSNGPVVFTFTAKNVYNTTVDTVTVRISEVWTEYLRMHRIE